MDRFRYCYGKKRGQKVENDARWIALCEEKQKINLEFSDDEDSKDKENISLDRRPSRKISQSNKFFPSRSARPKLDLSDLEDCEGPNQSQDCIPSKPLPIEDEIRKTEDAFTKVFRISDDDEDEDDGDNDDDDTSGDGRVLDDQKDPSVGVDKHHVVDDYQDDDDDDDRSDDDDDESDEDDDETPQDYPDTIAQYSQSAHLVKHDEEEEDEESLDDDDEEDDDDAEDDENEDADGVSRSMLSSFAGEESCLNCPSTTEVTANSINNGNDDSDDGTDRDCDGARVSDAGSFVSSRVREAEYADGYEADDDTRFHDGQTVADGSVLSTQSDVFHDLELEDYTCNDTNVTCDSNGESLMTSIVDYEDGNDISAVNRNDSDSHNVNTSRYTCTDKSSIDVTCDTCAEDTSLESFDNDDDGGDDENVAIELCDTCIDRSSATEYSTYAEGTHLESFGSDVRGDDDNDDDKEEGDDRDYDSDANDDDASTLRDTCIGNSSNKSFSTFPDGTELGSDDDDDPDCDYNDDNCENQATASCDTCIDTSTSECNTCDEETLLGPSGDDDVQSDVEDDDGDDDGGKEFDSKLYDTCIGSINNSTFACGTHLESDDDSRNDCYDNGNDNNNNDEDDNKIEASDIHGDDEDNDNEEDNEVSVMCDTCITLSSTNDCSTLSNSAHLEGSDDDDDKNDVTVYSCIDKPNTCTSNEGTHSRRFVDDNDVHGDDNDVHGNDNDDDENSASDLFSTCTGYFTRGCSSTFRTDGTHLHGDVDDDDCDNGDHDNDVKVVNSTHPCGDVSQVECSSSNHSHTSEPFFDSDDCHDGDKESNHYDITNASPKDVTTMTCDDDYDSSHHGNGEDDRADDDNDGDGSSVEITVLSQPSMLPNRHVSDKGDNDDDTEEKSLEANIIRDGDHDDDVQEMSCNFDDQCNNETIKEGDKDEDVTIVLCDGNDTGTLNGDIDGISDDIHDDKLVHEDIVTRTVDLDVTTEHVTDEDDGEMAAEDDIVSLFNLSVMEVSSKRDKRAKRKSSWRVFVGNDNNNNSGDDDDDVDRKPICLNETASVRRSVNPRFSIARVEDDVRKLSESIQALDVRDINGSTDTHDEILKFCGQRKTLNFSSVFTRKWIKSCKKIGEGAYAEVFEVAKSDEVMAIKVIPVRDDVGDSDQQSFREILFEMTISRELTRLRAKAGGFVDLRSVWFVSGKYPKVLMDAWDEYNDAKNSENDRPDFTKDQHYVVLGFEMAGSPLESFGLTDHLQVLSIVKQTSLSLAIAENDLSFEHRDLHLGNVLVKSVDRDRVLSFVHLGRRFELPSRGLKVTIIDYTLSRMTRDGCTFFKDLSTDNSLFEGEGDIQYDVYRHMRTATGDNWNNFTPVTNVLWLKHMVDKILTFAQQCRRSEGHSKVLQHIIDLTNLSNELERCRSACEFVERSSIFSDHPLQSPLGS